MVSKTQQLHASDYVLPASSHCGPQIMPCPLKRMRGGWREIPTYSVPGASWTRCVPPVKLFQNPGGVGLRVPTVEKTSVARSHG